MKRTVLLSLIVPSVVFAFSLLPVEQQKARFHTDAELAYFRQHLPAANPGNPNLSGPGIPEHLPPGLLLPIDSNILFPTGKVCGGCHGHDINGLALVTSDGQDVNIYDDWRSTMMANSARDPFWRAKVTHEMQVNPAHSIGLQNKCTSCHAPAGQYQSRLHDHKPYYLLSDLYTDTLGLDGVNCQMCHAQSPKQLGDLHSGELHFDTNYIRVAYGPYEVFFAPPMHEFVGITPQYSDHISDAGLCAGCHTLITETVDLAGQYTGNTFTEQATYHEWLNSRYDETHDNITCQGCHLPQLTDEIIISTNYQALTPKSPFGVHELAGANATMLKLLKENRQALGITAKPEHFDSTIAATLRMLQQKTLDMTLEPAVLHGDSAFFKVKLVNKAGHKFPSGYPSRRAWIEFEVKDQNGNTVFHSGRMNPDFSLPDEDANFEPHHNTIDDPAQVQIYELVPGDVNGLFTNVLERGHAGLKDNRLVPQGFSLSDPVYDTTQIIGAALGDPDFNLAAGSDAVRYGVPVNGFSGKWTVTARVWYQSLPPKWMAPMFAYSSPEIDSFKNMFDAADRAPVLVAERVLDSVYVSPVAVKNADNESFVKVFPTLSRDGRVFIQTSPGVRVLRVQVWDVSGKAVWDKPGGDAVMLPEKRGVYIVSIATSRGRVVEKVVRE